MADLFIFISNTPVVLRHDCCPLMRSQVGRTSVWFHFFNTGKRHCLVFARESPVKWSRRQVRKMCIQIIEKQEKGSALSLHFLEKSVRIRIDLFGTAIGKVEILSGCEPIQYRACQRTNVSRAVKA